MDNKLVYEVCDGEYGSTIAGEPYVSANGKVRSGGWKDPILVLVSKDKPADGIYEFEFRATPGGGPQMITDISARLVWDGANEAKGVRIIAETNKLMAQHVIGFADA